MHCAFADLEARPHLTDADLKAPGMPAKPGVKACRLQRRVLQLS